MSALPGNLEESSKNIIRPFKIHKNKTPELMYSEEYANMALACNRKKFLKPFIDTSRYAGLNCH
jgi:hypothetical protein